MSTFNTFGENLKLQSGSSTTSKLVFFVLACLIIFPFRFFEPPLMGLDNSWVISINLAIKNKLLWGKDYMFTFGPLGYLLTGLDVFVSPVGIVLFKLYTWLNLCAFLFYIIFTRREFNRTAVMVGLAILVTFFNEIYLQSNYLLLLCSLLWFIVYLKRKKFYALVLVAFNAFLLFFIKIDSGIVAIFLLMTFLLYATFFQPNRVRTIVLLLLFWVAIIASSKLMCIDITAYLRSSLYLINDYNDAMYEHTNLLYLVIGIVSGLLLAALIFFKLFIFSADKNDKWIAFFTLAILFIFFKHSYVRHNGFLYIQPSNIILLALLIFSFYPDQFRGGVLMLLWLLLPLSIVLKFSKEFERIDASSPALFSAKQKILHTVYEHYFHKTYTVPLHKQQGIKAGSVPYVLPRHIIEKIGERSVDVLPIMVSTVYFNNLHYKPRPGIQTYSVYNTFLDSVGAAKYASNDAPDFLLYSTEEDTSNWQDVVTIDNRYSFFEESKTKLSILCHYRIVDSINGKKLLFQHSDSATHLAEFNNIVFNAKLNSNIPVPFSNHLIYYKIKTKYSLLGRGIRFLYQPPALSVVFTLENGEELKYRIVKSNLEGGVLVNKFIDGNADAVNFYTRNWQQLRNIKFIRLEGSSVGFSDDIMIESYEVK